MRKSLILLLGAMLMASQVYAKYECTGIKNIVGQGYGPIPNTRRIHQDLDGDFKADVIGLYIFNDCFIKLRESKPGEETESEQYFNDLKAIDNYYKYLKSKRK